MVGIPYVGGMREGGEGRREGERREGGGEEGGRKEGRGRGGRWRGEGVVVFVPLSTSVGLVLRQLFNISGSSGNPALPGESLFTKQFLLRADETSQTLKSVDLRPNDEPAIALKLPDIRKISGAVEQGSIVLSLEGD